MHRYEIRVLSALKKRHELDFDEVLSYSGLGRDEALWAIENLKREGVVEAETFEATEVELTEEGKKYVEKGMPEEILMSRLKEGTINVSSLKGKEEQIGLQWAKKKNFVRIESGIVSLTGEGIKALSEGVEEGVVLKDVKNEKENYQEIAKEHKEALANILSRKLILLKKKKLLDKIKLSKKGLQRVAKLEKEEEYDIDSLDRNIIVNRSWKEKKFKPYDVSVDVEAAIAARKHPLRNMIDQIKESYLSLGFKEISGPAVESSFWVFDSLFMPQDHPAREMQETFYLSNPSNLVLEDQEYVRNIKKSHEDSWHDRWSVDTAKQAVLRTHMTSVSSRYVRNVIKSLLKNKKSLELPVKLFSIGRIFRNENVDYKHLADFYQTDGIVIGRDLTLANLFSILMEIYSKLDIKIRFKPSYFPFVEPGVECQAFSKSTNEWIEMGGAGLIRNEITGMKRKNISVLAWGLGVERILFIKDPTLKSLSELYNNNVGWLRKRKVL